jgi:hypothetical protein
MINERIYKGTTSVKAVELLMWCNKNGIAVHFHPSYKDKPATAHINLCTKAREAKFLPILDATKWKHYHYPSSNSCYKSVGFVDIDFS